MFSDTGFLWMLICWTGAVACVLWLMWRGGRRQGIREEEGKEVGE